MSDCPINKVSTSTLRSTALIGGLAYISHLCQEQKPKPKQDIISGEWIQEEQLARLSHRKSSGAMASGMLIHAVKGIQRQP